MHLQCGAAETGILQSTLLYPAVDVGSQSDQAPLVLLAVNFHFVFRNEPIETAIVGAGRKCSFYKSKYDRGYDQLHAMIAADRLG
jgi:hypothetical protein